MDRKKISELPKAATLKKGCCFPVVQDGETKKVEFSTLVEEVQEETTFEISPEGHLIANGKDLGNVIGPQGEKGLRGATGPAGEKGEAGITEEEFNNLVNSAVAEIVANAPEDFDTLKEMSDWISEHEDDAAAMNSAIQSNKTKIENEVTARQNAVETLQNVLGNKVDKVSGKGLSTNDYTTTEKNKLAGIAEGANKTTIDSALSSTSTNPVQNKVVNTALGNKVDKVSGKGLSTNDYTTDEKNKLAGIATGANKTTVDTALSTSSTNPVQNKVVSTQINTLSSNLNTLATQVGAMNSGYACAYACDAAASTKAKRITVKGFQLTAGTCIKVVFVLGNEVSKPTLNVNSTGDKEIKIKRFKDGYYQSLSLDDTTGGCYTWNSFTTLDLYYDGGDWIVLGNPVVANNAGYPTTQYKICIDGYKEIRGSHYYGDISSKKDINISHTLPCTLMEPDYCHVSLSARHSNESYPQSGEEMTYYLGSNTLKIHFFNRNESTAMKGVSFDYMICGY